MRKDLRIVQEPKLRETEGKYPEMSEQAWKGWTNDEQGDAQKR
jgi:hypothetical protein